MWLHFASSILSECSTHTLYYTPRFLKMTNYVRNLKRIGLITGCQQCNITVFKNVCVHLYINYMHVRNAVYMHKRLRLVQLERLCRLGYRLLSWGVSAVCHRPVSPL